MEERVSTPSPSSAGRKLNADPFSGYLFIFRTRRGTAIRVLQYDGQGFWLATKRLSKGRFQWWPTGTEAVRTLRAHQAQLLLAPAILTGRPTGMAALESLKENFPKNQKNTCVPFSTLPH